MILFPKGHVPSLIPTFHVGTGPDAFIWRHWLQNYQATNLFWPSWLCPSRDPEKAALVAENLRLADGQWSHDYSALLEQVYGDGKNADSLLCITTQTGYHADHIALGLKAGARHVCVDKPLVRTLKECQQVQQLVAESNASLFLTYNHTFNAPVHQIRRLAQTVGVKSVQSWFYQQWLNSDLTGLRQFDWRTDDPLCGVLDIFSHAENLAGFCLGSPMESVYDTRLECKGQHGKADIFTAGTTVATFKNGVEGVISFDQALPGRQDDIGICVYLNDGRSVMWSLELGVENLWISKTGADPSISGLGVWTRKIRGSDGFDADINATFDETPPGHQLGWASMWRYLYKAIAGKMLTEFGHDFGMDPLPPILKLDVPGLKDAEQTARFVEAVVQSFAASGKKVMLADVE